MVLSSKEIVRCLPAAPGLRNRSVLTTRLSREAAGVRVCKVAALKVEDIDCSRIVIRVKHGKGNRDCHVMLSPALVHPSYLLAVGGHRHAWPS
jgi:site-specific recombinase XerD